MRCDTVDVHDDLFAAQDDQSLVVFAGAGVSFPPPSSLPLFYELVVKIGGGQVEVAKDARLDEILGQMEEDRRILVHERCQEIIAEPQSQPNELHDSILRLFRRPEDIRIVTTNFDRHFTKRATALGFELKEYHAPALPVGSNFRGIVHLHGSIDEPQGMVLTDRDFGAAYLSEGWATTFLQALFQRYTVIFVGYSHGDPMVTYLNLGLRNRNKRQFVLTPDDSPQWKRLGIAPLVYLADKEHGGHAKLAGALKAWADQTALRPTDVAQNLQKILANPEFLPQSDQDFILRYYNREETVGAFVDHARLFDWITWLHGKGVVRHLLVDEPNDEVHAQLSGWLGRMLGRDKSGVGHAIVTDCGGKINSRVCVGLLLEMSNTLKVADLDVAQKQWIEILLRQPFPIQIPFYSKVAADLLRFNEWPLALRILELLTRTHVSFPAANRNDIHFSGSDPRPVLGGDHFDFTQTWAILAAASSSDVTRQHAILNLAENACLRLGDQCELLGLNNHHHPGIVTYDALTRTEYDEDSLGAFVRLLAEHVSMMSPAGHLTIGKLSFWLASRNQVLIRCALLALRLGNFPPAEVLATLVAHNGFYPLALWSIAEIEPLLRQIYPGLTEQEKQLFWTEVEKGPSEEWMKGCPNE